jgi:four helix bundle suffix protein
MSPEPLIPKHGGYRNLKSFRIAQLVYDVTVRFCDRYIAKSSRTNDQMVQAARSGVQNIAEGSQASGTSKKTELKLTNVARASLEELRLDYEDFLRQRALPAWARTDPRRQRLIDNRCATVDDVARWVKEEHNREQQGESGRCGQSVRSGLSGRSGQDAQNPYSSSTKSTEDKSPAEATFPTLPEIAANAALTLIAVACSLLDRQIANLAQSFETEGGFTERLYRTRSARRRSNL